MNFSNNDIPAQVSKLIQTLQDKGFEGWIVGGAIRTLLLNKIPYDWDITTNATPAQVQEIFQHTIETGIAYGTVTVVIDGMNMQVTTFRKESGYEDHRKPSDVTYCDNLEDDLSRRDFTMNAIAYDPNNQEFKDPFYGVQDIEQQLIKAVGDSKLRFKEDSLRILRAVRFQSQLGFLIETETLSAMAQASGQLPTLSRERIFEEMNKWLVGDHFSMTRETAQQIDFKNLFLIPPESTLFEKWDLIGTISPTVLFRFCAFFDLYTGTQPIETKLANCLKLLNSLKCSQKTVSKVTQFIEYLNKEYELEVTSDRLKFLKQSLEIGFEQAVLLLNWKLEGTENKAMYLKAKDMLLRLQKSNYETQVIPLAINGSRVMELLNLPQGPEIRAVLEKLENWVLDNPDQNKALILEKLLIEKKIT